MSVRLDAVLHELGDILAERVMDCTHSRGHGLYSNGRPSGIDFSDRQNLQVSVETALEVGTKSVGKLVRQSESVRAELVFGP
jgi:hypothetical protein